MKDTPLGRRRMWKMNCRWRTPEEQRPMNDVEVQDSSRIGWIHRINLLQGNRWTKVRSMSNEWWRITCVCVCLFFAVEIAKLEEFSRELTDGVSMICPFVRNRCSNGIIIPLASTHLPASPAAEVEKDLSLDSLDGADSSPRKQSTGVTCVSPSSSSGTFSRSETFEKALGQHAVPTITDDLADSTDSTCSDLNQLCNMSEYIEDHFLEQGHHPTESTLPMKTSMRSLRPQKRLLVPGLLNRLIYLRRVLSDSDLRQKVCCIGENEMQFHVYHANTIQEHSIELNLAHTYGSESELHVWSHDCAEQRRVADERQQQLLLTAHESQSKLSHIERMVSRTLVFSLADWISRSSRSEWLWMITTMMKAISISSMRPITISN